MLTKFLSVFLYNTTTSDGPNVTSRITRNKGYLFGLFISPVLANNSIITPTARKKTPGSRGLAASDWQRARAAAQDGEGEEVKLQALHVIDGADSR